MNYERIKKNYCVKKRNSERPIGGCHMTSVVLVGLVFLLRPQVTPLLPACVI